MTKIKLKKVSQIPIESIIALSKEELANLNREATEALSEAEGLKDWIDGIMAIKNTISAEEINASNYKNNNIIGGVDDKQTTDYI